MATKFALRDGVFTYQGLSFNVQGASVQLDGTHSLRSKTVDLSGVVLAERDRVADADRLQELVAEAVRSAVQEEWRRHPIGHHGGRHPGSAEDRPRLGPTLKGE